ncbi:LysR family transcriptional regulator [Enterobacter bugandensis]|uniref:LysR family transcriptional regulator n=1 Tax=Enterobacter bugandensis TaxID=881260 RepID=UPI000665C09A|nr:LysR family transcriptional regulator [Enterobacter bugandensis]
MSNNQILNDIKIFIYIVEQGSLVKAAGVLDIPLPTVSRRLMLLEENLGKKLMFRDNRSIKLTPFGELMYIKCSELIFSLDDEISKVKASGGDMSGVIKICAPRSLYYHFIHEQLNIFETNNKNITFNITLPSTPLEGLTKNDIIITKDAEYFEELTRKKLCESRFVLCAAPDYIIPPLLCPEDLIRNEINCIIVSTFEKWKFVNNNNPMQYSIVEPKQFIYTEEFNLARYFVMRGKGISLFPYAFVAENIANKELVYIDVNNWIPENIIHYILYAHYKNIPLKTKQLIDFLTRNGVVKF